MRFFHIIVGGTFDHLHDGHTTLLSRAFTEADEVTIGLTSDVYVQRYKSKTARIDEENISGVVCPCISIPKIQSFQTRKKQLVSWLRENKVFPRTTIVSIDDAFGPSVFDFGYDAIVVSRETRIVAKNINIIRTKNGLPPLTIIVVLMVEAEDTQVISSTRIRKGEINREGKLVLPQSLRKTLTQPIGTIIPDKAPIPMTPKNRYIISVGDTTTETLVSQGYIPTLAIIDFQAHREAFDWEKSLWNQLIVKRSIRYFTSGPGFISKQVMDAIHNWTKSPIQTLFVIAGEEDLLVLPVILYAPLGTIIYYGQPKKGIIQVEVTGQMKRKVRAILSQFI